VPPCPSRRHDRRPGPHGRGEGNRGDGHPPWSSRAESSAGLLFLVCWRGWASSGRGSAGNRRERAVANGGASSSSSGGSLRGAGSPTSVSLTSPASLAPVPSTSQCHRGPRGPRVRGRPGPRTARLLGVRVFRARRRVILAALPLPAMPGTALPAYLMPPGPRAGGASGAGSGDKRRHLYCRRCRLVLARKLLPGPAGRVGDSGAGDSGAAAAITAFGRSPGAPSRVPRRRSFPPAALPVRRR